MVNFFINFLDELDHSEHFLKNCKKKKKSGMESDPPQGVLKKPDFFFNPSLSQIYDLKKMLSKNKKNKGFKI